MTAEQIRKLKVGDYIAEHISTWHYCHDIVYRVHEVKPQYGREDGVTVLIKLYAKHHDTPTYLNDMNCNFDEDYTKLPRWRGWLAYHGWWEY